MWIVLSLALSLLIGLYVGRSFFEATPVEAGAGSGAESLRSLYDVKERSLRAIKDLELDHLMGKISRDDFERAKGELTVEVAGVLEEIRRREQR